MCLIFGGKNNNAPPHYPHKCQQDKEVSALVQLAEQCRFVKMIQVKRTRARKIVKLHKKLSGIKEHAFNLVVNI